MKKALWGSVLILAMTAGCAGIPPDSTQPLEGTTWVLSELPGYELRPEVATSLRFEQGRAVGTDGCNRYTVPYTTKGAQLAFPGKAASTQMACIPLAMQQGSRYMSALQSARSYRIEGSRLHLLSANGATLATLTAQSTSLSETAWRVVAINNGKGGVASVLNGTEVTMFFAANGQASGSAGCNRFTARYLVDGDKVRFDQAATTRRMCHPENVMAQEQAFVQALASVATRRLELNRLDLRTESGALAVTLVRDQQPGAGIAF